MTEADKQAFCLDGGSDLALKDTRLINRQSILTKGERGKTVL